MQFFIFLVAGYLLSSCEQASGGKYENSVDSVKFKISLLRKCGFYQNYASLNDSDLFDTLHRQRIADYSEMFERFYDPGMELMDYQILYLDKGRSVYGDAEAGVGKGNESYIDLIKAFAAASDSIFNPQNISETWESEQGPITVSFMHDDIKVQFQPKYYDDWLSEEAFQIVQQEMAKKGDEQFYLFLDKDGYGLWQNFLFLRLTTKQKECLEKAFGWKFSK